MLRKRSIAVLFATLAFWSISNQGVFAQVRRYSPPGGSPIPSQLDYFRSDVGVLDQYNTFVAPRRQLRNDLEVLAAREMDDFRRAKSDISAVRESVVAPTGVSAGFMNYSHYYSRGSAGARPARR